MEPRIAIIVLNWNCWPDTIECLESLAKLDYRNIDVIVVDNASSTDDSAFNGRTPEFEKQFPGFLFMQTGANLGYAGGNNRGIETALKRGAEWVLVLNPDTIVPADFLTKLLAGTQKKDASGRRFDIVAPKIMDSTDRLWALGNRFNWNLLSVSRILLNEEMPTASRWSLAVPRRRAPASSDPMPIDYVSGTALLIHRNVLERIGGIPEIYFLYYEDAEFCTRARHAGFAVGVVPEAVIMHKVSRTTKAGSRLYVYCHFRNGLLFNKRNIAPPLRWVIYCFSVWWAFKQVLKLVIPSRRQNGLAGLKGIKDFWLGRFGRQPV